MSICIYPGTFNPIHNGHIEIAKHAVKKFNFDKVVFIPAFRPPHKDIKEFDSENAIHRLNMVELAVKEYKYFDVSAIEYTRNKPSYSYDTVKQLYEILNPTERINFIIGTDAFIQIKTWMNTDKLKDLVNFILFIRENDFDETPFLELKKEGYLYSLMEMPFIDISSSDVRERIKQNKDICDIVPIKTAEYIKNNNVYKI